MKYSNNNITTFKDLDLELFFATEFLKLNSLHYGYWDNNKHLNLNNLKRAQNRYSQTLIKLIPNSVKTILDVGAGIGDNAKLWPPKGIK